MRKLILFVLCTVAVLSTNAQKTFEIGLGGSAYQFNRIPSLELIEGDKTTINMELRNVSYTGNIYLAKELSNVFVVDAGFGFGKIEKKNLIHGQLGLQIRMGYWFKSPYVDPYVRAGIGYLNKDYKIEYLTYSWNFGNVRNKDGKDDNQLFPVTAGAGINMWLGDRIGIGLQGDYMYSMREGVANSLIGSARIMYRIGGKSKKPEPITITEYQEREVEKIIEKIVEKEIIVTKEVIKFEKHESIYELLNTIKFDFDSYTIRNKDKQTIKKIAKLIPEGSHWLITGFTDKKGSEFYNNVLSLNRAESVKQELVKNGIQEENIKAIGVGKKISNAGVNSEDDTREFDRKVFIEQVIDVNYWDQIK